MPSSSWSRRENSDLPRGYVSNDYGLYDQDGISTLHTNLNSLQVEWISMSETISLVAPMMLSTLTGRSSMHSRTMFPSWFSVTPTNRPSLAGNWVVIYDAHRQSLRLRPAIRLPSPIGSQKSVSDSSHDFFYLETNLNPTLTANYIKSLDSHHLVTAG